MAIVIAFICYFVLGLIPKRCRFSYLKIHWITVFVFLLIGFAIYAVANKVSDTDTLLDILCWVFVAFMVIDVSKPIFARLASLSNRSNYNRVNNRTATKNRKRSYNMENDELDNLLDIITMTEDDDW